MQMCFTKFQTIFFLPRFLLWIIFPARVDKTPTKKYVFNPLKPDFPIVIFNHYKPRIAVAILAL